jgi:hypothetical protein
MIDGKWRAGLSPGTRYLRNHPLESEYVLLIQLDGSPFTGTGPQMLDAQQITRLHEQATLGWHRDEQWRSPQAEAGALERDPFVDLVLTHHRANFNLWHEEDKAREPEASDGCIASVKHNIDALNQTRNDLVEAMDRVLLAAAGDQNPTAPLHSESPGLMVDRLSILALKIYHTAEEGRRATASEGHRKKNLNRLALLEEQRNDLAACLDELWREVFDGKRRFKLYRQMKMYNDPDLNPAVYTHKAAGRAG